MSEGFVFANKTRLAVFTEVMAGESDVARIAKKHRLIPRAAERAVEELAKEGLVEKGANGYALSESGKRLASEMKRNDSLR